MTGLLREREREREREMGSQVVVAIGACKKSFFFVTGFFPPATAITMSQYIRRLLLVGKPVSA